MSRTKRNEKFNCLKVKREIYADLKEMFLHSLKYSYKIVRIQGVLVETEEEFESQFEVYWNCLVIEQTSDRTYRTGHRYKSAVHNWNYSKHDRRQFKRELNEYERTGKDVFTLRYKKKQPSKWAYYD